MFPPFIDSFGNQFFAVIINTFGTIVASIVSSVVGAITSTLLVPWLKSIGGGA